MKKFIHMWLVFWSRAIFEGTWAKGTANSHLWGETRKERANTCNRCEFRSTLKCVSRSDASFCLFTRKEIYRAQTSWRNVVFRTPGKDWRRGNTEKSGQSLSPSLFLPILSGPLGTNSGSSHGEFCIENNSVPGLFGNVAVVGDLNSRGEMWDRLDRRGQVSRGEKGIHLERDLNQEPAPKWEDTECSCMFSWMAHKSTIDHS